ncbi:MAG: ATP-binding protein [Cyanobacteria bacterium P01_D01_bin.156]
MTPSSPSTHVNGSFPNNPLARIYQQLQTQHQALGEELTLTKQALTQSYEQLQSIYYWAATTDSINQATSVAAIYEAASQGLQHVFNADLASFAYWDTHGKLQWNNQATAELKSVFEDYDPWAAGSNPYEPICVTTVAQLNSSTAYPGLFEKKPYLQAAGIEALLWLPIVSTRKENQQALLGYLGIYFYHPSHFDDALLALGQTMTNSVVLAVERKQSETQLQATLEELHQTQFQLIQNEKMSSLGQLVAGIAHEINNPVNFIYGNLAYLKTSAKGLLELVKRYTQQVPNASPEIDTLIEDLDLDFLARDLPKTLSSMETGTHRIRDIVKSLRTFSRLDQDNLKPVDLHEGIESTLMILQHRLKATDQQPRIEVVKDYGELPKVNCYSGPLNQVFMNILANAIDAINDTAVGNSRKIVIRTVIVKDDWVEIEITDSGNGIPDSVKSKIFDPFFTTKPIGKGTGMGLSISYKIVAETHQGQLLCYSQPKCGTKFIIRLPLGLTDEGT